MKNKVSSPKFRNGELGTLARDFLLCVVNNGMATERDIVRMNPRYGRSGVLAQYKRLVVMGFDVKRRVISLPRRHRQRFRHGLIPSEVVYYI